MRVGGYTMKFQDFLLACDNYEGEVFSDECEESRHSFSWDSKSEITKRGKEQFSKILNSDIKIIANGNVKLLDQSITQEEYDLWMEAVAGYVGVGVYEDWFGK